jgi:DNA-binding NarL/FixJ family response regulator
MEGAIREAQRLQPDIALMDVRLGGESAFDACREIVATGPRTRVLFLTSYHDDDAVLAAALAGANGYLLTEISGDALINAVKTVARGGAVLHPAAAKLVLEQMRLLAATAAGAPTDYGLSVQEQRVLALVAEGRTNKEIAAVLQLSHKTVKNYLSNMFQKLRISRRAQAVALFYKRSSC